MLKSNSKACVWQMLRVKTHFWPATCMDALGLIPGPSACAADVMPLHHVPSGEQVLGLPLGAPGLRRDGWREGRALASPAMSRARRKRAALAFAACPRVGSCEPSIRAKPFTSTPANRRRRRSLPTRPGFRPQAPPASLVVGLRPPEECIARFSSFRGAPTTVSLRRGHKTARPQRKTSRSEAGKYA